MKRKNAIPRFCFAVMLSVALGLTAHTQTSDTLVIRKRQFDSMVQDILIEKGQNAAMREGFDSLRKWYNELYNDFQTTQRNLQSALNERDTAHKYITQLRESKAQETVRADNNHALYEKERNKRKRPYSLSLQTGTNPFAKDAFKTLHGFGNSLYAGVGLSFDIWSFALRSKGEYVQPENVVPYNPIQNRLLGR